MVDRAPSPSAPPPHYAAATGSQSSHVVQAELDTFFDIVPQTDQTSFQVGYLGLQGFRAWVKGDVLIKLDERTRSQFAFHRQGSLFTSCRIALYGIESDQSQSVTIFSETQTLWQHSSPLHAGGQPSSSSLSNRLPSTIPFSFPLTSDLPHCIHLSNSSLTYRLEATLTSCDPAAFPDAVRSTQVHLTRYSHPGRLRQALEPQTWNLENPLPMVIQLQRKLYRRAEPIRVFIRIPPPPRKLLSLSLRSVEANLFRTIWAKNIDARHELLLAHSGKLCRLHSTRAIVLRLQLHPPFDISNMPYPHPDHDAAQGGPIYGRGGGGGCESITQETLLHDVRFLVRIHIGIRAEDGERKDVTLEQEITILPGAAGNVDDEEESEHDARGNSSSSATSSLPGDAKKHREEQVDSTATMHPAGTSAAGARLVVIDEDEEEYDGYEDVGRSLSDEEDTNRHALDVEDEPPPTLLESQNDLQVEVDVEGVGAGVVRETGEGGTSPPPIPSEYVWREDGEAERSLHLSRSSDVEQGEEALPPPLSPPEGVNDVAPRYGNPSTAAASRDGAGGDLDPSVNRTDLDSPAHHPPPYMPPYASVPASLRGEMDATRPITRQGQDSHTVPQPTRIVSIADAATAPTMHTTPSLRLHPTHPPPAASHREESFPPAYTQPPPSPFTAANPFPPRYEA